MLFKPPGNFIVRAVAVFIGSTGLSLGRSTLGLDGELPNDGLPGPLEVLDGDRRNGERRPTYPNVSAARRVGPLSNITHLKYVYLVS